MTQNEIVVHIDEELLKIDQNITKNIRHVASNTYKLFNHKHIDFVLSLCEVLLEKRTWMHSLIAYDFAYKVKNEYTIDTFDVFERWLFDYVNDWSDCDDFCTHAFGALLAKYNELFNRIIPWTTHEKFAVRRASAVILIYPIKYNFDSYINPFIISDKLLIDKHDLVQKGYGWMLKVLSQKDSNSVVEYLIEKHKSMPRTAFRYALEKLDLSTKNRLMKL